MYEHILFWSRIKGGNESPEGIQQMIDACDLTAKTWSLAGTLSGGQKRKLQLACMFIGNSSVCLMGEVTTGLDPLSRRTIWNIILAERSKRSMMFTTHFLDEGEVLADHIVILSNGQVKCQGSGAELKNRYGSGYRVHVPRAEQLPDAGVPHSYATHQDRVVYKTPDSVSAARLVAHLAAQGRTDAQVAGPTIEDVFLTLTDQSEGHTIEDDAEEKELSGTVPAEVLQLSSGKPPTFAREVITLMKKRLIVIPRYWIAPLLILTLPIACTGCLQLLLGALPHPRCVSQLQEFIWTSPADAASIFQYGSSGRIPVGPSTFNGSVYNALRNSSGMPSFDAMMYHQTVVVEDTFEAFQQFIRTNHSNIEPGGVYAGDSSHPATIAYDAAAGSTAAMQLTNLWSQARSGIQIAVSSMDLSYYEEVVI